MTRREVLHAVALGIIGLLFLVWLLLPILSEYPWFADWVRGLR